MISSLLLAFTFRRSSSWPGLDTRWVMPGVYCLGMMSAAWSSSAIRQKEFGQMKTDLLGIATLFIGLLLSCFY